MELFHIAARLCTVLALGKSDGLAHLYAAYYDLVAIDQDLASWYASLTPRFLARRTVSNDSDPDPLDTYDSYESHVAAGHVNRYRCIRIGVNEMIIRFAECINGQLPHTDEDVTAQRHQSLACIVELSQDICYSVRYFLDGGGGHTITEGSEPTMYASTNILMPLCVAANEERIPPRLYQWILGQVSMITRASGFAQTALPACVQEKPLCGGPGRTAYYRSGRLPSDLQLT